MERLYRDFAAMANEWRTGREALGKVVFTNGCFDILHAGHVAYLEEAKALGDFLVLGLNDDDSVCRLKGPERPIVPFQERAFVLSGLKAVDLVVGFSEDTPLQLIRGIEPDLLVKGGDYTVQGIVGAEDVLARGGEVRSLQFRPGSSTTNIVETIKSRLNHQID